MIYPQIWHPFKNFITTASRYMILAITVERYLVICHRRKNVLNPSRNILAVFLFSLLATVPKFFEFVHVQNPMKITRQDEAKDMSNGTLSLSYEYDTSLIGEHPSFLIFNAYYEVIEISFCLLTICYCNYQICFKIKLSGKIKNRYTT